MMNNERAWPITWRDESWDERVESAGFLVPIAGAIAVLAILRFVHAPFAAAVVVAVAALLALLGFTSMVNVSSRRRGWDGATIGGPPGVAWTELRWGRRTSWCYDGALVASAVLGLSGGLAPYLGDSDQVRPGLWLLARILAPILLGIGLAFAVMVITRIVRRRRRMGVALAPLGLYQQNWLRRRFYGWEDITGISPKEGKAIIVNYSERRMGRMLSPGLERFFGLRGENGPQFVLPGRYYEVSPLALYYVLCYYRLHPEHRAELGTETALERIRAADFPDVDAEIRAHGLVRPELFRK